MGRRDGRPAMAVEMMVRAVDARPELAEAALANDAVRRLIAAYPEIYTEAGLRRGPKDGRQQLSGRLAAVEARTSPTPGDVALGSGVGAVASWGRGRPAGWPGPPPRGSDTPPARPGGRRGPAAGRRSGSRFRRSCATSGPVGHGVVRMIRSPGECRRTRLPSGRTRSGRARAGVPQHPDRVLRRSDPQVWPPRWHRIPGEEIGHRNATRTRDRAVRPAAARFGGDPGSRGPIPGGLAPGPPVHS